MDVSKSQSPPLRRGDSPSLLPLLSSVKFGDVLEVLAEGLTFPALHCEFSLLLSFL